MKSVIKISILTVIVYTGIFFLNCGDQQLKTIARVGGRKITVFRQLRRLFLLLRPFRPR